jgi:hypothetical protein
MLSLHARHARDISSRAAPIFWVASDAGTYRNLTLGLGFSTDDFEAWIKNFYEKQFPQANGSRPGPDDADRAHLERIPSGGPLHLRSVKSRVLTIR